MPQRLILFAVLCLTFACAGSATRSTVSPRDRLGDPVLYTMLAEVPLSDSARVALGRYAADHPRDFLERIALVAEDPNAGTEPRYNAVLILGERKNSAYLPALRAAATDPDPRVRAAVAVAASQIAAERGEGGSLLEAALQDRAPEVQAKALELIGASNLPLLRTFVQQPHSREMLQIARSLIRNAEDRGAPLASDSAGVLRRQVEEAITLEFRPTSHWPQWSAANGTLTVTPRGAAPFSIEGVEAVGGVVPAFFSPDLRYLVYEQRRTIFVRDLQSGTVREVGAGIAPRPRPFTGDFVFLREQPNGRTDDRDRTRLRYEVLRASFEQNATPQVLGVIGAYARTSVNGGYSPVRWLRVVETEGRFTLESPAMETFQLPDPFTTGAQP